MAAADNVADNLQQALMVTLGLEASRSGPTTADQPWTLDLRRRAVRQRLIIE